VSSLLVARPQARLAWRAYRLGRRVVVPGFVNSVLAWSARALPFELLLPVVGWLMEPRDAPASTGTRKFRRS
jgi:hypothetical protein